MHERYCYLLAHHSFIEGLKIDIAMRITIGARDFDLESGSNDDYL